MTSFEYIDWPCPAADGGTRDEIALVFDRKRPLRLLVLPAWLGEANKLRRQAVEVMRRLDLSGIDSMLPDFPGCNESTASLGDQTLEGWRAAAAAAAGHFAATHVLAVRAGALLAPDGLPGWCYAPAGGRQGGIEFAGWAIGTEMLRALELAEPAAGLTEIEQSMVGGADLWLRAEPDEDPAQADAIAAAVAIGMTGE